MWICSNCETANDGRKKKCAVCDLDRVILDEDVNLKPSLKNKLNELENQIVYLKKIINDENIKYIKLNKEFVDQRNQFKEAESLLAETRRNLNISDVQRRELRNNLTIKSNELSNLKSTYNVNLKDLERLREYVGKLELEKLKFESTLLKKDKKIDELNDSISKQSKNSQSLFLISVLLFVAFLLSIFYSMGR